MNLLRNDFFSNDISSPLLPRNRRLSVATTEEQSSCIHKRYLWFSLWKIQTLTYEIVYMLCHDYDMLIVTCETNNFSDR